MSWPRTSVPPPPHVGRGGWTWHPGSAGSMYRAGIEGLLGLDRGGPDIMLARGFPRAWPRITARLRIGASDLAITIDNPRGTDRCIVAAALDGVARAPAPGPLRLTLAGRQQAIWVTLGIPAP